MEQPELTAIDMAWSYVKIAISKISFKFNLRFVEETGRTILKRLQRGGILNLFHVQLGKKKHVERLQV